MSWIKKTIFYILTLFILFIISYLGALTVEQSFVRDTLLTKKIHSTLSHFEKYRASIEDNTYRIKALHDGFVPLFYPNLLRGDKYIEIGRRHDVAALAPQPNSRLYYCNEGYGIVKYVSDRFGFRNKNTVWNYPVDLALIGDSFTQGACIPDESGTISGNLSKNFNVVNLGTASNGPIHYASLAKVFIKEVKPKYVAMIFYPNDNLISPRDNEESLFYHTYWEKNYNSYFSEKGFKQGVSDNLTNFYDEINSILKKNVEQALADRASPIEEPQFYGEGVEVVARIRKEHPFWEGFSKSTFKLRSLKAALAKISSFDIPQLNFSSKLALDTLEYECNSVGCTPLIIYIPNSHSWRPDGRALKYKELLKNYADAKQLIFVDTTTPLSELQEKDVYAVKGPHLSPNGYKVVSKAIVASIDLQNP